MVNIKIGDEYLDLAPGTTIQRERNSPFFLSKESGKDGIPGEVSYPFGLPLSRNNMRLLNYSDYLPSLRPKQYDIVLMDEVNQVSAGVMQMRATELNLSQPGVGKQDVNLLCNSSAFAKLIEGKKLKDLSLGGPRNFAWDGYNITSGVGLWKHCHDTWNYTDCDDGDYVFFPVNNGEYGGYSGGPNCLFWSSADNRVEIDRNRNVASLCPHIYLAYLVKQCFSQFGYTLTGDILEDPMFKRICMLSFRGVHWSDIDLQTNFIPSLNFLIATPLSSITINLSEHVPQDVGIGEFLVELCKFLPIGLEIDDNSRTCNLKTLGKPTPASRIKDITGLVSPLVQCTQNESDKNIKKFGIRRNFNTDNFGGGVADISNLNFPPGREQDYLPLPAPVLGGEAFRLIFDNGYYAKEQEDSVYNTVRLGDNLHSYEPAGATDYIESNMVPVSTRNNISAVRLGSDNNYHLPHCLVEGNWYGKPAATNFGMHVCFYQGKNYPFKNNASYMAPYASSTNNRWVTGTGGPLPEIFGSWSMAYELGQYGMLPVWWAEWLKILAERETLKATLSLNIVQYLQLRWGDELLIENTSYILKKITEVLPYADKIEVELVRWIKGNT